jgi:hypothetical protein
VIDTSHRARLNDALRESSLTRWLRERADSMSRGSVSGLRCASSLQATVALRSFAGAATTRCGAPMAFRLLWAARPAWPSERAVTTRRRASRCSSMGPSHPIRSRP